MDEKYTVKVNHPNSTVYNLNPKSETQNDFRVNPQPSTLNPQPYAPNLKPHKLLLHPTPYTPNP